MINSPFVNKVVNKSADVKKVTTCNVNSVNII